MDPYNLVVLYSRSSRRVNPNVLSDDVLDSGKTYSFYVEDIPADGYTQVEFFLDAVLHNTEYTAPWDFDGTAGGGEANVTSLPDGPHNITAIITTPAGPVTISADLEVN